jgi:hypothetical protein
MVLRMMVYEREPRDYAQLSIIINYDGKHPKKIKINRFNKMSEEGAIRSEIRNIINDSNGPLFIRLAFHTLASYDVLSQTIALNFENSKNKGLEEATEILKSVKQNHQWISSRCFVIRSC